MLLVSSTTTLSMPERPWTAGYLFDTLLSFHICAHFDVNDLFDVYGSDFKFLFCLVPILYAHEGAIFGGAMLHSFTVS